MARKLDWNIMKQSLDIDEVEHVLGISVLSTSAHEDVARCPLPSHTGADANPSFAVNRTKMVYNCFTCGEGGSIPQLVMALEGIAEWADALEWLVPYVESMTKEEPDAFALRVSEILHFDEEQSDVTMPYYKPSVIKPFLDGPFDYYVERGIPEEHCRAYSLGYATNYTKFNPKAKTEWVGEAAIIPHFFLGNLVGYQARLIDKPLGMPKFDNTSNFPKAETLYGYDFALEHYREFDKVYVVESALTAVYIYSLGGLAVGTFGAQVADQQIRLLRRFPNLVLAFDADKPGETATEKIMEATKRHVNVEIMAPLEIEKGDLLDLKDEEDRPDRAAAKEAMDLTVPASLYEYYFN